ncbi:hypothetical protein WN943_015330 [Citrus x changshan-huyou]
MNPVKLPTRVTLIRNAHMTTFPKCKSPIWECSDASIKKNTTFFNSYKHQRDSQAYEELKKPADAFEFAKLLNGHLIVNEKNNFA